MDIILNPRGNGACPLCKRKLKCRIRKTMKSEIEKITIRKVLNDHPIEAVIYSCPAFIED